jgi:SAM-dependent methyltransferase
MSTVVNTHQAEAWNGYEGQHWADHQDRWDAVNAGFTEPLLRAAGIGEHDQVLDVGCGNGLTTRLAARRAPRGHAVGVDLSAPMLARAQATADREHLTNIAFEQGDAQVHPFPDNGFDVAISRFGIMFFADPIAAFTNIGRALRPGGRLAFVCMRDIHRNEWVHVLAGMRQHLPRLFEPPAAPDGPGMFSLADPTRVDHVLTQAGFTDLTTTPIDAAMRFGRDAEDATELLFTSGPVHFALTGTDPATANRARDAITAALRSHVDSGGVHLRGAAWLVTASRPQTDRSR